RGAEEILRGRHHHRQPVCAPGHHRLDSWLEEERLADRGTKAGEERRAVAAAGCSAEAARGALALGQGPCRPSRERTRRSARARRHRDGKVEAITAVGYFPSFRGDTSASNPKSRGSGFARG